MNENWHNVSAREPCPVCQKPDWCSLSNDGAVCLCHRVESDWPAKSGDGWFHRLKDGGGGGAQAARHVAAAAAPRARLDYGRIHAGYDADPRLVGWLAERLGVGAEALAAMDVRYNRAGECWSFPMRDAAGRVTGLRFRAREGSEKWSATGSRDGLFCAAGALTAAAERRPEEMVVAEGATDCAALLTLGPAGALVVGRSSCQTGAALLAEMRRRVRPRVVTVVADNDAPGIAGARRLAEALAAPHGIWREPVRVVVVPHPCKDAREWWRSGRLTARAWRDITSVQRWA